MAGAMLFAVLMESESEVGCLGTVWRQAWLDIRVQRSILAAAGIFISLSITCVVSGTRVSF